MDLVNVVLFDILRLVTVGEAAWPQQVRVTSYCVETSLMFHETSA